MCGANFYTDPTQNSKEQRKRIRTRRISNKAAAAGLKKTGSFMLKKPPSMKIPSPPVPLPPPAKIEYPTSPELILGEEIFPHSSHPQHPLSQVDVPDLFTCESCKEYGSGYRFSCRHCKVQLHEFCASAPPLLLAHPFHVQHQLSFCPRPGGIMKSKCDICAKPTRGFAFRCNACSFQMHPCCAMLSNEINVPGHPHTLRLLPAAMNYNLANNNNGSTSDSGGGTSFVCGECNRRRSGRVYRCTVCEYHLHAVCAKSMVNGLQANGYKGQDHEKPSMFGTAVRIASQAVIKFIGRLIEGVGEGVGESVGEMFAQSITNTKGRPPRPPPTPPTTNVIN